TERELESRLSAGVEMLMKPTGRRAEDASDFPIHFDHPVSLAVGKWLGSQFVRPHQSVALGAKDQEHGAATMMMRLGVASHRPISEVRDEAVTARFDLNDVVASAMSRSRPLIGPVSRGAPAQPIQSRRRVTNEIDLPKPFFHRGILREIVWLPGIAIRKLKVTALNKFFIVEKIEDQGRCRHGEKERGFRARVNEFAWRVQRPGSETAPPHVESAHSLS